MPLGEMATFNGGFAVTALNGTSGRDYVYAYEPIALQVGTWTGAGAGGRGGKSTPCALLMGRCDAGWCPLGGRRAHTTL